MRKRKTSRKRGFSLEDIPTLKTRKSAKLEKHDPSAFFNDFDKVGGALLESLVDNDTDSFIEILDAYLRANKSVIAKRAKISRSTVQSALSKNGNPTLKTIARIVHEAVA